MSRRELKLEKFFDFAISLSNLSYCKRAKVGCVICDKEFTMVHSIGYNGPPSGIDNDSCTGEPGNCGCVHAEANAMIKLGSVSDVILLSTTIPCVHCAGLIVNSRKISSVFWISGYRSDRGSEILKKAGIGLFKFHPVDT